MTDLEQRALKILSCCSLRLGSGGKRFVRQLCDQPATKLTEAQALFTWQLVHMYRRQIPDPKLLGLGSYVHQTGQLPHIYQPGDHREAAKKPSRPKVPRPSKPTRIKLELDRGGGRLAL